MGVSSQESKCPSPETKISSYINSRKPYVFLFIGIPITAFLKDILRSILHCLLICQLFSPCHTPGSICARTRISEFGITGCLFVLRIPPIVPSFGTDMITKLTIDKDRCRIRTPRTTQIYFFHSRSGRQLTVFKYITEFFTLRSGSCSDIRITFTMQFTIFE